jgi:hypothetical protein
MDASPLAGWENFYVIVGSSAGGLTGLTFVVIALIGDTARGVQPTGVRTYVTPTMVHFGGVLALAAFLSMPHQGVASLSAGFAVAGIAGLIYSGLIAASLRRQRHSTMYVPVLEDWIWNVILPTVVYGCLAMVAVLVWQAVALALYAVAALSLIMLFIGIHNAWDIAVWMTLNRPREPSDGADRTDADRRPPSGPRPPG